MDTVQLKDPYGFLYITTNLVNGKRYIGAKTFDARGAWKNYMGSGKAFLQAMKKYGKENFRKIIVSIHYSKEELYREEEKLIKFFNAVNDKNYYNLSQGQYYNKWMDLEEEEKSIIIEKIKNNNFWNTATFEEKQERIDYLSKKFSGENNPFFNKRHTQETKDKISKANKGKLIGDERLKYWKGKTSPLKDRKMDEESKKKMSVSAKNRIDKLGAPNCKPISIFVEECEFNFPTIKKAYEFCKSKNLILLNEKNMCIDSFKKRLKNNDEFSSFTYKF